MRTDIHHIVLSNLRILVADNSTHTRTLLRTMLNALGVKSVAQASNGEDAFRRFKQEPIDLIITDWAMAPGNGPELIRRIRTAPDSPCPDAPVILLTAHAEGDHMPVARDLGVDQFLAKPVTARDLYARILAILQARPLAEFQRRVPESALPQEASASAEPPETWSD